MTGCTTSRFSVWVVEADALNTASRMINTGQWLEGAFHSASSDIHVV
jgi:hypothetical protein